MLDLDDYNQLLYHLDRIREIIEKQKQKITTETIIKKEASYRNQQVFNLAEAAEYIGCSQTKLRDMIRRGEGPPHFKAGVRYLFREAKILEWMRMNEVR